MNPQNNIPNFDPAVEIDSRVISEDFDIIEQNNFNDEYQDDSDADAAIEYDY